MRSPLLLLSVACIATVPALGQNLQCAQATVLMVDSDYALAQNQQNCATLRVVGVLTASRRLILSSTPGTQYTIINATKGGNALSVGTGSGGSVAVPSGSTSVVVTSDGLNYTLVNASGGGGTGTVTSVAGVSPQNGNVPLTAQNVGAVPADGATQIAAAQVPQLPASKVTGLVPVVGGTQALSGGTASVTVPSGTSLCTATDQSAIAAVQAVLTGTTLTLNGTGTDTIAYQCMGGGGSLTATTTTLAASSTTPTQGQSVTFTATVAPSAVTGTVTFADGGTTLGTGTLSGGTATYSTSSLAVGSHIITAAYGGNSTYAASTSSATAVTVNAPPQGNIAYLKGCSSNPCSLSSLPAGSLVMLATINGNNSSATVADSAGGTMPSEVSGWPKALNGGQYYQHLWAIPNLAGSHTLTISYTSEYYAQTAGSAFSGASTTSPIDAISYNPSGYAPQCASVTPSASTDMLFSVVTGISTPFSATNMTNPTDNGAGSEVTGAYTQAGVAAFTPAWNLNSSTAGDFGCASIAIH